MNAGDPQAIPFDDRDGIATPKFYSRLRELGRALRGWLYQDRETERVVLVRGEAARTSDGGFAAVDTRPTLAVTPSDKSSPG